MMITITIDPNVRVGLGRYDEGERATEERSRALIFAHGFILSYVNGPV